MLIREGVDQSLVNISSAGRVDQHLNPFLQAALSPAFIAALAIAYLCALALAVGLGLGLSVKPEPARATAPSPSPSPSPFQVAGTATVRPLPPPPQALRCNRGDLDNCCIQSFTEDCTATKPQGGCGDCLCTSSSAGACTGVCDVARGMTNTNSPGQAGQGYATGIPGYGNCHYCGPNFIINPAAKDNSGDSWGRCLPCTRQLRGPPIVTSTQGWSGCYNVENVDYGQQSGNEWALCVPRESDNDSRSLNISATYTSKPNTLAVFSYTIRIINFGSVFDTPVRIACAVPPAILPANFTYSDA